MKSYLEQVHKAFDEKFYRQTGVFRTTEGMEQVKAFFDEQLKAFVEMKKEAMLKEFDEIGFGNQAMIVGAKRVELKDFIRKSLSEGMESEEAEGGL